MGPRSWGVTRAADPPSSRGLDRRPTGALDLTARTGGRVATVIGQPEVAYRSCPGLRADPGPRYGGNLIPGSLGHDVTPPAPPISVLYQYRAFYQADQARFPIHGCLLISLWINADAYKNGLNWSEHACNYGQRPHLRYQHTLPSTGQGLFPTSPLLRRAVPGLPHNRRLAVGRRIGH